jgi:hypothetical protein
MCAKLVSQACFEDALEEASAVPVDLG